MTNTLLTAICRDLGIPATPRPEEAAGYAIWSGTGRAMLAALWDTRGKEQTVSIAHCKRMGLRFLESMGDLCPGAGQLLPEDPEAAVDEIYRIYRRNGLLYQQGDRCAPSIAASAGDGTLRLRRGLSPMEPAIMSGLGFLDLSSQAAGSISEMFQLQTTPLDRYLEEVQADDKCRPWRNWAVAAEYLRQEPTPRADFWKSSPDVYSDLSMARYPEAGRFKYVLCKVKGFSFDTMAMTIPEWRLLDPRLADGEGDSLEYLRLANALMRRWGTRPAIRFSPYLDGTGNPTRIRVKLYFPLPPTEQDFFLLYSWPEDPTQPIRYKSQLNRIMNPGVFQLFRSLLQPLGYGFQQG